MELRQDGKIGVPVRAAHYQSQGQVAVADRPIPTIEVAMDRAIIICDGKPEIGEAEVVDGPCVERVWIDTIFNLEGVWYAVGERRDG